MVAQVAVGGERSASLGGFEKELGHLSVATRPFSKFTRTVALVSFERTRHTCSTGD